MFVKTISIYPLNKFKKLLKNTHKLLSSKCLLIANHISKQTWYQLDIKLHFSLFKSILNIDLGLRVWHV